MVYFIRIYKGYGFIEFESVDSAGLALQNLNGKQIPNTNK